MSESSLEDVLGLIEGQNVLADVLDGLKTKLEDRGWSNTAAEHASISVMGPIIVHGVVVGQQGEMNRG